jgi:adenosylcobinamide-GDP ribazoletransferase
VTLSRYARHELRLFAVALQFLTRCPVPSRLPFEPAWLQDSARHFPAVGLCVGGVGAAVLAAAAWVWPLPVAVGLSMAATVCLTGAFHEDGLADTCDALGGAVSRERALEIMKDSRVGGYAVLALVLVMGLKAASLISLGVAQGVPALVLGHAASRAAAVSLLRWLPYAGDIEAAKAKPLAQRISGAGWAAAWLWVLGAALLLLPWAHAGAIALALGSTALAAVTCAAWLRHRLGGFTGDTLGATQQFTELAFYLGWLVCC